VVSIATNRTRESTFCRRPRWWRRRARPAVVIAALAPRASTARDRLPKRGIFRKVESYGICWWPTDQESHCPYKGPAEYWSAKVGDRLVEETSCGSGPYSTPLRKGDRCGRGSLPLHETIDLFSRQLREVRRRTSAEPRATATVPTRKRMGRVSTKIVVGRRRMVPTPRGWRCITRFENGSPERGRVQSSTRNAVTAAHLAKLAGVGGPRFRHRF